MKNAFIPIILRIHNCDKCKRLMWKMVVDNSLFIAFSILIGNPPSDVRQFYSILFDQVVGLYCCGCGLINNSNLITM